MSQAPATPGTGTRNSSRSSNSREDLSAGAAAPRLRLDPGRRLRAGEAIGLERDDIDLGNGVITIRGEVRPLPERASAPDGNSAARRAGT